MTNQKCVGIIGGLGPASTLDYYKGIIKEFKTAKNKEVYPPILLNSLNLTEIIGLIESQEYEKLIEKLIIAITQLKNAGADFVAISSNTPHIIFNQLEEKSPLPLISIVEATTSYIKKHGFKKVLLTGTSFTMNNSFYQKTLNKYNIKCITPNEEDKIAIQNIIFPNLENGVIIPEDKEKYLKIVNKIKNEDNIDGLILGCTELPLMIKQEDLAIPIINTTEIHIHRIVKELIED